MKKIMQASKNRVLSVILCLTLISVLLLSVVSCGSAKGEVSYDSAKDMSSVQNGNFFYSDDSFAKEEIQYEAATDSVDYESPSMMGNARLTGDGSTDTPVLSDRKIIKNVTVIAETKEYDKATAEIEAAVSSLGGYMQASNKTGSSYNGDKYASSRRAYYTIRIPAENLDAFMGMAEGLVNITSKNANVDDITETYTDIEARLETLKTQETRLLELLAKANNLDEIIILEDKLSNVRYEIERYTAQIKNFDTRIAYSTVTLTVNEVIEYTATPVVNPSFGERMKKAFTNSWKNFAEGCKDFAVEFTYALPGLLLFIVIAGTVAVVTVAIVKKSVKKHRNQNKEDN